MGFGFGRFKLLLLPPLAQKLKFYRGVATISNRGEALPNFGGPPTFEAWADVRPANQHKVMLEGLAEVYETIYTVLLDGAPDVRSKDRTYIDGMEAEVVSVSRHWNSHTELMVGTKPATRGAVGPEGPGESKKGGSEER